MTDINSYIDIGKKILEHDIFRDKYGIESPNFPGESLIEKTLWAICKEKDKDTFCDQEQSTTASITKTLNRIFNTGD